VVVTATTVVAVRWWRTEWGGNDDVERAMQSVIKRGGNARREVTIQQIAGARDMVAQLERTSTREVQREERDSGVTREGRGGMARDCTGSTTKGEAAQQQVI
jgi:hypothetical protein